ncbi:MAG: DMT family transporter [Nitrospirota bacterium]
MDKALLSVLAGLGGMLGWGIADFLASLFSKKIGYFKTFFWSQLAGLVFVILLGIVFLTNFHLPSLMLLLLPIAAIFHAGAYLFFYKAFELGNILVVSATINLWVVFTIFFAFIFLDQRLSALQFLGIAMIIAGVTLVSLKWSDIKNQNWHRLIGVKETIISAFLFGVFWTLSDVITSQIGWLPTTIFVKVGVILFLLIFSFLVKHKLTLSGATTSTKRIIVLIGILDAAAIASVNWGLTIGDAILIIPISSAVTIVTVTLALIFLKESVTKTQGLGIVTAVMGIALTAF